MPANLPPDYYGAERRYREAKNVHEKIEILREMMAIMPKHKGTEHLRGDLKRKLAKLNAEKEKKSVRGRSSDLHYIQSEGAGQVILVGLPNSGKSTIVSILTEAHVEVAEFPFSTFKPIPGMMQYEDVQIQLVDLPPISTEYVEPWLINSIRIADLVLLITDISDFKPIENYTEAVKILNQFHVYLKIAGDKRPQGIEAYKTSILVWTKLDALKDPQEQISLQSSPHIEIPQIFISSKNRADLDHLARKIFEGLEVIRIYTKTPGKKIDYIKPYILPAGTTVFDAARVIHKDLAESMTYARIWGSEKYEGQRVEKNHKLMDKDVLEIHNR